MNFILYILLAIIYQRGTRSPMSRMRISPDKNIMTVALLSGYIVLIYNLHLPTLKVIGYSGQCNTAVPPLITLFLFYFILVSHITVYWLV